MDNDDEILFCSTCKKPILRGDIVCQECSKLFQPVNSSEEVEEYAKFLRREREQRFAEFDNEYIGMGESFHDLFEEKK